MTLIILDNGIRSPGDHSYAISRSLIERLRELGMPTAAYAFTEVQEGVCAELGCIPHFRRQLYDHVDSPSDQSFGSWLISKVTFPTEKSGPSERLSVKILNESFYEDLLSLPPDIWMSGNIVLFPGIMQHQILGLARFLSERRPYVFAKVVCQLMFEPTWLPWGKISRTGIRTYRKAFALLGSQISKNIFFTTENVHISAKYYAIFNVKPLILPIPLARSAADQISDNPTIQIGFFGYSKAEKGFHLLPEAIHLCLAARSDLSFKIQIQHHENESMTVDADKALRKIPGIIILDGALSTADFAAATAPLDVMLLPYDPKYFGLRGSGLYVEAISAGRVIVAAEGIWAAQGIAAGEAVGAVFSPYSSAALAAALLHVCENVRELRREANLMAADHAKTNSMETYVNTLLSMAGVPITQNGNSRPIAA